MYVGSFADCVCVDPICFQHLVSFSPFVNVTISMVQLTQSCSVATTMPVGSSPTLSGCSSVIVRRHYESRPGRTLSGYSFGNRTPTRYRPSFDTGSHRPRHDSYLWRENSYAPLGTITRRAFASPTGSKSTAIAHTLPHGLQQGGFKVIS